MRNRNKKRKEGGKKEKRRLNKKLQIRKYNERKDYIK